MGVLKGVAVVIMLVMLPVRAADSPSEQSSKKEKILMVVANKVIAPTTGWPVGFWAAELTHPYFLFEEIGFEVDIASPNGGDVMVDAYSDPRHESQYAAADFVSRGFLESPKHNALLANTLSVRDVNANDYVAIVVAGGQSPMFTFKGNKALEELFLRFYRAGKPSAALCHGVAILMDIKNADGSFFIKGKKITGFSLAEDQFVDKAMGTQLFDWYIEPLAKERGANYSQAGMWASYAVSEGNLITGQQQMSGLAVAKLVVGQLKK